MTKMREKNGIYERQPFELFAYHDKKPTLDHSVFHFHNNYEILLYVKGNLEIYIEQSRYLPVPGTMFVIVLRRCIKVQFWIQRIMNAM